MRFDGGQRLILFSVTIALPQTSYLNSLSFSFVICEITIRTSTSLGH